MPDIDIDRVNAVISMSPTIQARQHKGNAAAIYRVIVDKSVDDLFTKAKPKGSTPDLVDMRIALAEKNIFLNDEQITTLQTADKAGFLAALVAIQIEELSSYLSHHKGPRAGTTPGYYKALLDLIAARTFADAQDYINALEKHKPDPTKEKQTDGQLMQVMNKEYVLYAQVDKDINFGSKADNIRYHYFKDVIYQQKGSIDPRYTPWQEFVSKNDDTFPEGFSLIVHTLYEKKGPLQNVKNPIPEGQGHHISIVNFGMSGEQAAELINNRDVPCPMHEVQFTIEGRKYGIYLVDGKPLTFYKAELTEDGKFETDTNGKVLKTELKASESADLKSGRTVLLAPFNNPKAYTSVTHAIADSIKRMKVKSMGHEPTPYLTADSEAENKTSFGVQSGTNKHKDAPIVFSKGGEGDGTQHKLVIGQGGDGTVPNSSLNISGSNQNANPVVKQKQGAVGDLNDANAERKVQGSVTDLPGNGPGTLKIPMSPK